MQILRGIDSCRRSNVTQADIKEKYVACILSGVLAVPLDVIWCVQIHMVGVSEHQSPEKRDITDNIFVLINKY